MIPGARNTDPWTSHAADDEADLLRTEHHGIIIEILDEGSGTQYEIAYRSNGRLTNVQVHRRMIELVRRNWARDSGGTRPSPTNRQCIVWERVPVRQ